MQIFCMQMSEHSKGLAWEESARASKSLQKIMQYERSLKVNHVMILVIFCRAAGVEHLMYVKEDLIIPHVSVISLSTRL